MKMPRALQQGFTLIEMMVVAPIVILLIGGFIALIVNLTGEALSSNGASTLAYNLQSALNRIDDDVRTSTQFLAANNIDVASTKQGYSDNPSPNGGTANFTNINKTSTGGSYQSIVLESVVTSANPLWSMSNVKMIFLANQPNDCNSESVYSSNTPMKMNIVYFIDNTNSLWRRIIMPSDYANTATYCGSTPPWQQPSCIEGYNEATLTFCKTTDEKLLSGVTPSDFSFAYYANASATTANTVAANPSTTSDATRTTALQSTSSISVTITTHQTVAGRDISRTGTIRSTRLNAQ
jgi:competence protein ComGC